MRKRVQRKRTERKIAVQKIGFCDRYGLTQAVLNGTKTMTRRVIKDVSMIQLLNELEEDDKVYTQNADIEIIKEKIARYKLGEILAVAQSYKSIHEAMMSGDYGDSKYDAFRSAFVAGTKGWSNKMFVRPDLMPHQIKITDIRIERLHDISDEDCLKEGIIKNWGYRFDTPHGECVRSNPRDAFACLIDCVSGKGTWESNPWVVVYEFKLVK
jgi:hypothetical protein